jgi:hypothetical protein
MRYHYFGYKCRKTFLLLKYNWKKLTIVFQLKPILYSPTKIENFKEKIILNEQYIIIFILNYVNYNNER